MPAALRIQKTVAAIRAQIGRVAGCNGLQPAVVESWLSAVEEQCGREAMDEPTMRVYLRVLERWVSPVSELTAAHADLVRLSGAGAHAGDGFPIPRSANGWIPPARMVESGLAAPSN